MSVASVQNALDMKVLDSTRLPKNIMSISVRSRVWIK